MDPATPPTGETPVSTEPKTNANPPAAPAVDTAVEEANKRAAQAEMQANMLRNQLKDKEDADKAAAAEKLKEQNKFKELYEQSEAEKAELLAATEKSDLERALKAESDKLFAEFPEEVRALADEVGLQLTDADEDTVAAFKSKLESISGKIKAPKVTANNPGVSTPATPATTPQELHEMMRDPEKFEDYVKKTLKGVQAMTRSA